MNQFETTRSQRVMYISRAYECINRYQRPTRIFFHLRARFRSLHRAVCLEARVRRLTHFNFNYYRSSVIMLLRSAFTTSQVDRQFTPYNSITGALLKVIILAHVFFIQRICNVKLHSLMFLLFTDAFQRPKYDSDGVIMAKYKSKNSGCCSVTFNKWFLIIYNLILLVSIFIHYKNV